MSYDWSSPSTSPKRQWVRFPHGEHCPVCGRHDWCTRSTDGKRICCMRVKSPHPCGGKSGGWFHDADGSLPEIPVYAPLPTAPPDIDCAAYLNRWETPAGMIDEFAATLGLAPSSLRSLGARWAAEKNAWAFPMRDGDGRIVGIRLRGAKDAAARKWSIVGSRQGLFLPPVLDLTAPVPTVYLCEGPTDTAALLGLGLNAMGRPNDRGGGEYICARLARFGVLCAVVVVLDRGESGIDGGNELAAMIQARRLAHSVRTLLPPEGFKDARAWVRGGATADDFGGTP